jgi:hypothetical protein
MSGQRLTTLVHLLAIFDGRSDRLKARKRVIFTGIWQREANVSPVGMGSVERRENALALSAEKS